MQKHFLFIVMIIVAISLCGTVSADTVAANDVVNGSVNVTASTNVSNTPNQLNGSDCLPTVAHGTINGEVYISSIANWPSKSTTNNFNVPNGTVVYAKYYVGIWMPGTASSTFNGNNIASEAVYPSGMGVTWISYNVTNYVIAGQTNTATSTSTGGDDRQYGSTLVVVLQNENDPLIEYWITEGLDWLNYNPPPVDWSNTTLAGTVDLSAVQNASLYSIHLTGYNYEDLNGYKLPTPTEHIAGSYFDALRWDNIQNLLVAENQRVNAGRGDDTYTSIVFHALTITYKEDAPDIVPVNLTPTIVDPNVINTLTATIENQGKIDATSPFNVSLLVDGTVVDTKTVTSLASGNSTTVDFQWTPVGTKNTYNLTVIVDPENAVAEYREDNNMLNLLIGTSTASKPVAEFTANTTSGNEPLTVNFTDQSTNEPTSWLWDFGDGTTSTDQNPIHPYTMPGVYNVTLKVTNAGGSSSKRKTDYITVNAVTPVADFKTNNTSFTTSSSIQFNDTSIHYPTSWFWEFGDGTTSTEQNPTHTYTAPGIYTVKLAAMNSAGFDTEEKTNYIAVYITPVADFTATPTTSNAPITVTFKDQSSNMPTSWLWDFGDGTTSTSQNPTHTYSNLGTYTVKLTVTNLAGTDSITKTGYIVVLARIGPIWASKSAWNTPDIGSRAAPCFADLDGDGDYDLIIGSSAGTCYAYENTGTASNPVWTAKSAWNTLDVGSDTIPFLADLDGDGDYDLLIGNSQGITYGYENTGTASSPVWTAKSAWNAPDDVGYYAMISLGDLDGDGDYDLFIGNQAGNLYCYENTGNVSNPVWTRTSKWNMPSVSTYAQLRFGDLDGDGDYDLLIYDNGGACSAYENTGTTSSPLWTYRSVWNAPDPGRTIRVSNLADLDGDGDYDLLIGENTGVCYAYQNLAGIISDLTPTSVDVTSAINPGTPCNVTAVISNNGTADVGAFVATLSVNGVVVDTQNVLGPAVGGNSTVNFTWTPTAPGNYNITVTADSVNRIDESDETNNNMTVSATVVEITPVVEFSSDVTNGDPGLTVNFTDESSNAPTSWLWNFGDGTTSTEQNPTHTYTKSGTYTVTLTSANTGGSNSTVKTGYITVYALTLVAGFTANSTTGTGPFTVQFTDQTTYESTHMPTSWFWEFGDGTTSTEQNPTHTYTAGAKYTVKLLAMNEFGLDTESKTNYITVYMMPAANFTASTTSGSFPLTVTFTDKSSNLPTAWLWDFGDGTNSTNQNPTHTYTSVGTYTVTLTATNIVGNDTNIKTGYITITQPIGPKWSTKIWQTADIGSYANPIWADLDGDGDYDLLIGGSSGICYAYENTGNATTPTLTAKSTWDTPSIGTYANPAFADLDGDGDYDILIGANDGVTYAYENTGNTTSPVWTAKPEWNAPNVGSYAAPCSADLDGDGDYDLLIGAYDGVTYAYENTGNTTSPVWTAKPEWNVEDIGDRSNPCLGDLDGDGDYDMLIGSAASPAHVYAYENIGNATSPVWTAKPAWDTPYYFDISAPCLGDIDGDGDNDALIGWQPGDARCLRNDGILLSTNPDLIPISVDVPSSIIAGIPCTVSAVISNNGKLNVGAFVATLSVDGVVVDTQSVTGPAVGSTSTVTFNWNPDTSGNHSLMVTVDSIDGITESDETNNTITEDANVKAPPVAEFTVNNTNVTILDSVQFTDMSNNLPTSWQWDFGDGATSTERNPTHTYSAPGKYTVKLTVTNSVGSDEEVKTDYITVNAPDLIVTGISPNVGAGAYMFANEPNVISVTVKNNGTVAAVASTLNVTVNGTVYTVNVPALAAGASTTVTVTDPVSRKNGDSVPVSAAANPDNAIPETNTSNNGLSASLTVYNNGYKGKRYTDGSDIDTQSTFQGNYDVIYSPGNSTYSNSGWISSIVTWTYSNLVVPAGATVVEARLYQPYTWDKTVGQPQLNVTFNGNNVNYIGWYSDTKGFGTSNYPSGLFVYDVASLFNTVGNTVSITPGTGTNLTLYGSYLVVVYQDPNATNKTIIINDGCDMLCSNPSNSVNDTEATAYSNFQNVNTSKFVDAKVIDVLASADGGGGANYALFNGNVVGSFSSDYLSGPEIGFSVFNVTSLLQNGVNVAGMQSYNNATKGDNMVALNSILVITMDTTAPVVTASPVGGNYYAPQTVTLKANEAADIYYTLDGSTPTKSSTRYTAPISVTSSKKLSFIGVDSIGNISGVKAQVYRIYKLVKYSYTVKTPYKKVWYRHWYKKSYKHWYKSHGKWAFKWRSYWKKGWAYHWKYKNTVKTGQKYVLT